MSIFQIVVIGLFIFLALFGVVYFAEFSGLGGTNAVPTAVIWGTLSANDMNGLIHTLNQGKPVVNITYIQKDAKTFDADFTNAVAEGSGPDLIIVSDDLIYKERNKLVTLGATTLPRRQFLDTYVGGSTVFLAGTSTYAVPFTVDPLVMYWNKDIFSSAGVARPPQTWADLSVMADSIIQRKDAGNITRALVPFGGYANVTNAKEILSTLFFEAGNGIVYQNLDDGTLTSVLDQYDPQNQTGTLPVQSALDFYTEFSNPTKKLYTWNKSFSSSLDAFLAGNLALYFGNASEFRQLRAKNPNLNFDVALVPQQDQTSSVSYGRFYGLALVKSAANPTSAFGVINVLTTPDTQALWATQSGLPPARSDLLAIKQSDPYLSIFYKAAVQSKAWIDPDPVQTNAIFQSMVESITSGSNNAGSIVSTAKQQIDLLFR